ncbi:MAG: DUF4065 domain-containing protein [Desulfovibrio sp.]|jgi:uncharacterized phage-associated protein|nr:DUF4065 domain-containing protein [Desulfovibrio sp.]
MNESKRDLSPNPVQDVADFFLVTADPHHPITQLKLQKLCAFAQAFSLAFNGCRLFDASIEEYPNGPVVRELLDKYQTYGRRRIPPPIGLDEISVRRRFSPEQRFPLDIVNSFYDDFTAGRLVKESHRDFPGTWSRKASRMPIPDAEIKARFEDHSVVAAVNRVLPVS